MEAPESRFQRPEFKFQAQAIRKPNQVDVWVDNGLAFAGKLAKQLIITLVASLFRAAADWLLKGGDQSSRDTLAANMKGTSEQNKLYDNNAPMSSYNRDSYYNPSHNRWRSNGSESFPGLN